MNRITPSISTKITIFILIAFSIIFISINVFIVFSVHSLVYKEIENQLESVFSQIMDNRKQFSDNSLSGLEVANIGFKLEVAVFSADKKKIYSNYSDYGLDLVHEAGIKELKISSEEEEKSESADHFLVFRSSLIDGDPPVYFQISKNLEDEDRFFLILKELLTIANLLGISLAAFVGYWISTKILKPVDIITRNASSISAEDLSKRISSSGSNDEISRLIDAFNAMLDRLENSFEKQQRFVADASHELRTPISIIQGNAGMLQRWAKDNPAILDESLTAIRNETLRMGKLIDRLLFLAKSDSASLFPVKVTADIALLLREITEDYRKSEGSPVISLSVPEKLPFFCDPDLIRQVIRILVDNGIKYSSNKVHLEISASIDAGNGSCCVSVKDYGVGIAPEHLPHLFDRFFRVDLARGREDGGAGLGLSIAQEICEAHGGTLSVESRIGEGSVFSFHLPSALN